ncbi:TetR/AcrR family transcriptional regulator [Sporosarcina sp. Te-1]|uniref:TetR/AcrR family transcriptional regulator n=1 Tax=Sporosarcina sp. Te-1 TaxID=2818390 RepID=UPI001A9D8CF7|nr:TetR/AcrR family transcriptional regulator [Sporosarcina sp. Te-1]QTD42947.1 TetR/AcrR family transcriptional regulator [Sporosarcina sp. Te-1]
MDNNMSKREEIIQIALRLFMEKGYEHTTINNIIQAANVSKGGMYHHFKSKEEILDVVIHHLIDEDSARFKTMIENENMTAIEKLNGLFMLTEHMPEKLEEVNECIARNQDSLFDYRAQELSKERSIPYIVEIIRQGMKENIFQTDYPEETGEFFYLLADSIFVDMQKNADKKKIEQKINAFVHVISQSLCIRAEELEPMKKSMLGQFIK